MGETEHGEGKVTDTRIPELVDGLSALINAAPAPLRRYIHDIETRCDPASDVRTAHVWRETAMALAERVRELEAELTRLSHERP